VASFETAVQKAIYEKLIANADIISNAIPVYDAVPQPVSVLSLFWTLTV
jgi:hypothetical protein